ncbi:disease resistance response protein 206-like [Dorcoceras hygrometricum]|uniref:Dirigent protein n=1 Tax=Dorcoceras hygrometricum TaxID=472368 RepID=A0A2Z7AHC7_9LAMI|nr:disease resistance response protein 206-like [Dorcoceras hygrometricum]
MAPFSLIILISIVLSFLDDGSASQNPYLRHVHRPCKSMVVYFHDIRYNGNNDQNATSRIVGEPEGANKTSLVGVGLTHFGDLIAFDDPLTEDNNLRSPPAGRAQGFYLYDGRNQPASWHGFSMIFNSTKYKGTLTLAGLNVILAKTRDISVVGGTGDFFMHRGIATFSTDAVEDETYFRLRIQIKLYECWKLMNH